MNNLLRAKDKQPVKLIIHESSTTLSTESVGKYHPEKTSPIWTSLRISDTI